MLPSSHQTPIIRPLQTDGSAPSPGWEHEAIHPEMGVASSNASALALAEAFADFVSTSSRLESSYRELQLEVAALHKELGQRNEDLKVSLADNQRVRLALQQVVDSMPCGVLVADARGTISVSNPEIGRILDIERLQDGATLGDLKARCGLDLTNEYGSRAGAAPELECRLHTGAGERWLQTRQRELTPGQSSGNQTIFIISDITAHKRAERDREAARSATVLAEITTMLAHEIRNPLASLELFAELIEQDDDQRGEWISNLRAGIRSLSGTVNNVLSMHDQGALRLSIVSLNLTITSAVRFVQPVAAQAGICIEWTAPNTEILILGSESALQQVLLNLIRNAIRHTPAKGTVKLSLDQTSTGVQIKCSDSGSGIRVEQLDRLFEAGFSGSGDTPGLGLAVCKRIMQQHAGTIDAANVTGSGACFTLSFPRLSKESAA